MTQKASKTLPLAEASRLWSLYGLTSPKELILEDLAMAMNIFVVDARLDSAAARLVRKGDFGLIRISDGLRLSGQRRFAIAHEIGHFVMHKKVSQLLACTDSDMRASYRSSAYEIEASIFAGALLMPRQLFQARMAKSVPTADVIKDLAREFDTSLTATALRYIETSKDYCVFVVSENNKIRWWRASDSFGNHNLWLDSRTTLPRHSAAAAFFRDGESPDEPIEVDVKDWFGELEDIDSDYAFEQAIPLPEFDQVISLIWLP
jgi:Zn-dependent peptidase ImmA (M78 family)